MRFPVPEHVVNDITNAWSHGFPYKRPLNDFHNYAIDLCQQDKQMIPHCLPILCIVTYIMGTDLKDKCHHMLSTTDDHSAPEFLDAYNETLRHGIGILGQSAMAADKWNEAPIYFKYNTHWHLGCLWMLAHNETKAKHEFLTVVDYCGNTDIVADAWIALAYLAEENGDMVTRDALLADFTRRVETLFPHQKKGFVNRALSDKFVQRSPHMQEYFQKYR